MIPIKLKISKKYVYFMYNDIQVHKMHVVRNKQQRPVYNYEDAHIDDRARLCVTKIKRGWHTNAEKKRCVSYPIKQNIKNRLTLERKVVFEKIKKNEKAS